MLAIAQHLTQGGTESWLVTCRTSSHQRRLLAGVGQRRRLSNSLMDSHRLGLRRQIAHRLADDRGQDANAAKMMVPTNIRDTAKAVPLNKFTAEQVLSSTKALRPFRRGIPWRCAGALPRRTLRECRLSTTTSSSSVQARPASCAPSRQAARPSRRRARAQWRARRKILISGGGRCNFTNVYAARSTSTRITLTLSQRPCPLHAAA